MATPSSARKNWYRLDNIGNYYAAELGRPTQTVFRFSATMTEEVDPTALQDALDATVALFPNFNVCLRTGFFWHYLQERTENPLVTPENEPICARLHFGAKSPLLRVSYYRDRINFELSHMVSDGRGSLNFFKELLRQYLISRYHITATQPSYQGTQREKAEDAFSTYYERVPGHATKLKRAYQIPGIKVSEDPTYLELHLSVRDVLGRARAMGVTLTALLIAVLIQSIREEMNPQTTPQDKRLAGKIIRIGVPIDLRTAFKSATTKNFFGLAFVSHTVRPYALEPSLEELAQEVQAQLKEAEKPENLKPRMMQMVSFEKNRFIKMSPVFLKDKTVGFFDWLTKTDVTSTLSNVGLIKLDERFAPYVKNINVLTGTRGLNFVVASYEDDLSIGISTIYTNFDIICRFVRFFTCPRESNAKSAAKNKDSFVNGTTVTKSNETTLSEEQTVKAAPAALINSSRAEVSK